MASSSFSRKSLVFFVFFCKLNVRMTGKIVLNDFYCLNPVQFCPECKPVLRSHVTNGIV